MPYVSVVMPVYNGMPHLKEAVESILNQTFKDFELLVVNDGSKDDSEQFVRSLSDSRVRLIVNEKNLGLIASLNKGIDQATGTYIARMDQDDIAMPDRLKQQVRFLETHAEVSMCGTSITILGTEENKYPPVTDDEIRVALLFNSPFYHPTVMIRKSVLDAHGLRYNEENKHAEDYGFWVAVSSHGKMANLPYIGLHYRRHATQYTKVFNEPMAQSVIRSRRTYMKKLGVVLAEDEEQLFSSLILQHLDWTDRNQFIKAKQVLNRLSDIFNASPLNKALLKKYAYRIWRTNVMERHRMGFNSYLLFSSHSYAIKMSEIKTHLWFVKQLLFNLVGIKRFS